VGEGVGRGVTRTSGGPGRGRVDEAVRQGGLGGGAGGWWGLCVWIIVEVARGGDLVRRVSLVASRSCE
jgi:hypothetical protein